MLVAIIIGSGLFGIPGMVVGVPTFAVLYSILSESIKFRLKTKNIKADYENNLIIINEAGVDDETI